MGEIVNLRRVKKAKRRASDADTARENRVRHGRTGAQKANDERQRQRQVIASEGAKLPDEPG